MYYASLPDSVSERYCPRWTSFCISRIYCSTSSSVATTFGWAISMVTGSSFLWRRLTPFPELPALRFPERFCLAVLLGSLSLLEFRLEFPLPVGSEIGKRNYYSSFLLNMTTLERWPSERTVRIKYIHSTWMYVITGLIILAFILVEENSNLSESNFKTSFSKHHKLQEVRIFFL